MNGSWVLDAWAILALLQAEEPAAGRVRALVASVQPGDRGGWLHMSLINLGEVFYRVGRTRNLAMAETTLALLRELPIHFVPVTESRILAAARLKAGYALSYADAFAAALASELGGTLLTGDPELIAAAPTVGYAIEVLERGRR